MNSKNILKLPDGRNLCYADYGNPKGKPVFIFHGIPGSRIFWETLPGFPFRPNLRLIAPDRPGYGYSDFKPGVTILENYPNDVATLADSLGIKKFSILGLSGGGPYAMICALKIPERIKSIAIISSMGPMIKEEAEGMSFSLKIIYHIAPYFRWLARIIITIIGILARFGPVRFFKLIGVGKSESDKKFIKTIKTTDLLRRDIIEAYRQHGAGQAYDLTIPKRWPIPLEKIKTKIYLWQGEEDRATGKIGHYLEKQLPNCEAIFIPDAGHFWNYEHMNEIFDVLSSDHWFNKLRFSISNRFGRI